MTDSARNASQSLRRFPPAVPGRRAFGGRMRACPVLDGPGRGPAGLGRGDGDLRQLPRPEPERSR
ncbi:hypothetical protein EDC22_1234 [Tepidamorphus gemmatus]|uniref:Uncharacterized protein n=1 Tax=Tepidamorphus gemmatus TaxID=747076 RepID=A0A4R3LQZ7_9HYPH|nr:hypothetical protein EDC22_1234 [Tepidamorphus gemmatus]